MISPFKIKPFFIRVVHTLHESCSFFLLRMYASEDWAFKCRCPSCKCRQATARWQHGRFSAYHTWASLFFFCTAVAKQSWFSYLTCETFVISFFLLFSFFFTDVPDTILSLLSPFCKAHLLPTIKSCSTSEILTRQAGILLQFGYVCR